MVDKYKLRFFNHSDFFDETIEYFVSLPKWLCIFSNCYDINHKSLNLNIMAFKKENMNSNYHIHCCIIGCHSNSLLHLV